VDPRARRARRQTRERPRARAKKLPGRRSKNNLLNMDVK
jgi:hypothetical protein